MPRWLHDRTLKGWRLERSSEGLARIVSPGGKAGPSMAIGKALASFHTVTMAAPRQSPHSALFIHGMLGERERFEDIAALLKHQAWAFEHFRYRSASSYFRSSVHALERQIERSSAHCDRLCLIAYSFGCRLVAAAIPPALRIPHHIIFIAPPTRKVGWAKRGMAFAPVRRFLGGSLSQMAHQDMDTRLLDGQRLLVIEGQVRGKGDGWLQPEETQLKAAHSRVTVNAGHSELLSHPQTQAEIARFLRF